MSVFLVILNVVIILPVMLMLSVVAFRGECDNVFFFYFYFILLMVLVLVMTLMVVILAVVVRGWCGHVDNGGGCSGNDSDGCDVILVIIVIFVYECGR